MNIVIFGANGPTGRELTTQALTEGHNVTAITRHLESFPLHDKRLRVVHGDVYDPVSVEQAIAGQDAVLSALGVPYSRKPITVYSQGAENIMRAMRRSGVRRLVCVSSSATDPQVRFHDTHGGFIFEKVLKPFLILGLGKTLYADMWRMETELRNSELDWTIVRPSGLFETPTVTDYQVAESVIDGRFTSRADLANCMLRQFTDDRFVRKAVAVATSSAQPSTFDLILREGFKRQPAA